MRKRQFGSGRKIYASDHNTAQNYTELNLREIAMDAGLCGIVSGGTVTPHISAKYTIIINDTIARTSTGERIVLTGQPSILAKPKVDPGEDNEIYIAVCLRYAYQYREIDTDQNDIPYFKDYQNSYDVSTVEGTIASSGHAQKPNIPTDVVLLCDILYDHATYISGMLYESNIDTSRQIYCSNDDKYVNASGDAMSGSLQVPSLTIKDTDQISSTGIVFIESFESINGNGVGTIKLAQDGTMSSNSGFLKIYINGVAKYIPIFDDINGMPP